MIAEVQNKGTPCHPCIHSDEDITVYLEDSTIGWIMHCVVHTWSLRVYKKMMLGLAEVLVHAPHGSLYAVSNNNKLTKFASMFGMESIDDILDKEGNVLGELLCLR